MFSSNYVIIRYHHWCLKDSAYAHDRLPHEDTTIYIDNVKARHMFVSDLETVEIRSRDGGNIFYRKFVYSDTAHNAKRA